MTEIWKRRNQIDRDRRLMRERLMKEYDDEVYYPALKNLIKECGQIGHVRGKLEVGLFTSWYLCQNCGCTINEESK